MARAGGVGTRGMGRAEVKGKEEGNDLIGKIKRAAITAISLFAGLKTALWAVAYFTSSVLTPQTAHTNPVKLFYFRQWCLFVLLVLNHKPPWCG